MQRRVSLADFRTLRDNPDNAQPLLRLDSVFLTGRKKLHVAIRRSELPRGLEFDPDGPAVVAAAARGLSQINWRSRLAHKQLGRVHSRTEAGQILRSALER